MILTKFFGKNAVAHAMVGAVHAPDKPASIRHPDHIEAILDVLNKIARDVVVAGERLIRGAPIPAGKDAIYCTDIARLFERHAADGSTKYLTFHYTQDLKTLDPNAQVHLSQFFGRIVAVNGLLAGHNSGQNPDQNPGQNLGQLSTKRSVITAMLDQILLESLFFTGFFNAYSLSADLLAGRISAAPAGVQFAAMIEQSRGDFVDATPYLHDAAHAFTSMSMTTQQLIVMVEKPYEDGQRHINDVYFDKSMAAQMQAVEGAMA
jgi:hypothetical protein